MGITLSLPIFQQPKLVAEHIKDVIADESDSSSGSAASSGDARCESDFTHRNIVLPKNHTVTTVDPRDVDTPDSWIPRHPDLIRLTGKHPFNCEPPLSQLFNQGFITPVSLHYVRNHGKTPNLHWKTHRVAVKGLVQNPMTFSMDAIAALPSVTMPVSLICAGNRRKENNMIKQTRGFHWGAAAHSTSLWTGVRLSHLLQMCGADMTKASHVRFSGSTAEELPPGTFGSSVDISTAVNEFSDILIAYLQNGKLLQPDHGFPVRVIIPGWVGARMVKWLDTIEVSELPSDSHYHYYDNRIFPSFVDAELADAEDYWRKDEYVFNELNVNSVIVHPEDSEKIDLSTTLSYTVQGYAYSGGGRKITRVEVSFDGGNSWKLCKLSFPEEQLSHAPQYGRYYCWMFWEYIIDVCELLSATEIRCRAWDESNNTQPERINWNLLGYGNNCQYTLKIKKASSELLEFLHPTVAGPSSRGWMTRPAATASAPIVPVMREVSATKSLRTLTKEDVLDHSSRDSAWIIIDGNVYDATSYLDDHPGGAASILIYAGKDATQEFNEIHSEHAKKMLNKFTIGVLSEETEQCKNSGISAPIARKERISQNVKGRVFVALNPDSWTAFELISKVSSSPNTRLLKFKLPSSNHRLGLPVGGHILARATINDRPATRAYTPVSSDDDLGTFTLCVKVYFAGEDPRYPEGGKMSQCMDQMSIGESLLFTGPLGQVQYKGRGTFVLHGEERRFSNIGLICGGTGITPAYQVLQSIFKDPEDNVSVTLLYGNRREEDILMRKDLEMMQKESTNIHVWYTVEVPTADWKFSTGLVSESMIQAYIPVASGDTVVLVCGPRQMEQKCTSMLLKIGHSDENVYTF